MSDSLVRKTFSDGVGKRILELFMLAAIVPMVFTATLAYNEFNRGLHQETEKSLKASAKEYGIEILSRLELAESKAVEIMRLLETQVDLSETEHQYLLEEFDAIWHLDELGRPTTKLSGGQQEVERLLTEQRAEWTLPISLKMVGGRHVLIAQTLDGGYAFLLQAQNIWGARENLPRDTEYCVFSAQGTRLNCTTDVSGKVYADLMAVEGGSRRGVFAEIEVSGSDYFAAQWQLFLQGRFGAEPIDIVALQRTSIALQSATDFRRVFIPAVILVLVLVIVLSLFLAGRSLTPLRHLTSAAKQVAAGNYGSRVRVRTGDEFQWLAEAFNTMTDRIGQQVSALKAMSKIDHLILSGAELEQVSDEVVSYLMDVSGCEAAAIIARDADAPDVATMISYFDGESIRDRVTLPNDAGHQWCQPRQVRLQLLDEKRAPYAPRFRSYDQNYVSLIPVVLQNDLKGLLLLGFRERHEISQPQMQRCVDLAGRFAVALASVEREDVLYRQAHYDALTGLPNRQLLKDRLKQHLSFARSEGQRGAILFLDLDQFKKINDAYGHTTGDAVLVQAGKRIEAAVSERDTVARLGGDEFVALLPNISSVASARAIAETLLDSLRETFTVGSKDHYLSASIGVAVFPDDGATVETVLKNADAAMYRAKEAGRNRFEFFSQRLNTESRRRIELERDLRSAFRSRQLEVYYQPQFDISTGVIAGAEALLRWTHPTLGPISPGEFIPLAEESGLIVDIGSWVIEQSCRDLAAILNMKLHPGPVSINVSGRQLASSSFEDDVLAPINKFAIHPGYVRLEVTETTVAQNREKAIAILKSLRGKGVGVAIDDFGTGYSSLSYLQQMPFDVIKIDKSFIDKIGSGDTSDNICRTIIKMAEQLGKKSIAEGAEVQSQIDFLRKNGCDVVQGFFYSKALPVEQFKAFLQKQDFHTQRRKALEVL